jgi:hypothetical protein
MYMQISEDRSIVDQLHFLVSADTKGYAQKNFTAQGWVSFKVPACDRRRVQKTRHAPLLKNSFRALRFERRALREK